MLADFISKIRDLLTRDEIKRVAHYPGHKLSHHSPKHTGSTVSIRKQRLGHCIRVSYFAYRLASIVGANKGTSARAGLLHDCGFDPESCESPFIQVVEHPLRGAKIAHRLGEPEEVVSAVFSHMFPLNIRHPPSSLESFVVWLSDKVASVLEFFGLAFPDLDLGSLIH
jgi:putative nucleotidyltransferase with HDIG domain